MLIIIVEKHNNNNNNNNQTKRYAGLPVDFLVCQKWKTLSLKVIWCRTRMNI